MNNLDNVHMNHSRQTKSGRSPIGPVHTPRIARFLFWCFLRFISSFVTGRATSRS